MRENSKEIISEDEKVTCALAAVISTGFALLLTLIWYAHSVELDRASSTQEFSNALNVSGEIATKNQRIGLLLYGLLNQGPSGIRPTIADQLIKEISEFTGRTEILQKQTTSEFLSLNLRIRAAEIAKTGIEMASIARAVAQTPAVAGAASAAKFSELNSEIDSSISSYRDMLANESIVYALDQDTTRNRLFYVALGLTAGIGGLVLGFVATRVRTELRLRRQSEAKLLKANAELEHFSSIVAHDLNGPLANISLASQLLAKDRAVQDSTSFELMKAIQRETRRLHDMVAGLLQLSRIGRKQVAPKCVDIHHVLAEIENRLRSRIEQSGCRIGHSGKETVWADPTLIEQLLQNLVDNSLKYARDNVAPKIQLHSLVENHSSILIYEDNGKGIPAEIWQSVFEPFHQGADDAGGGVGLGLSVVKKIIGMHDGSIEIVPHDSPGTRFVIRLPSRGHDTPRKKTRAPKSTQSSASSFLRRSATLSRLLGSDSAA